MDPLRSERVEIDPADLADVESPERAQDVLRSMRALADNPKMDDRVREMARGVLSGDLTLREAVLSDVYMDALGARVGEAVKAAQSLSPEEEQKSEERFQALLAKQERDEGESQRAPTAGRTSSGVVYPEPPRRPTVGRPGSGAVHDLRRR
ncbi:hypothetical protein ABZY90_07215 [Streptomyces sp. NPDC006422]|uniref:hypothetical protein n=1 Tax=unclassified Streptomyces TaxID=2593676 RepID=UPI0033AC5928